MKTGFMCKTDFDYELGNARDGVPVFSTIESCKESRRCVDSCGMVEVKIIPNPVASECVIHKNRDCNLVFTEKHNFDSGEFQVYPTQHDEFHSLMEPLQLAIEFNKEIMPSNMP